MYMSMSVYRGYQRQTIVIGIQRLFYFRMCIPIITPFSRYTRLCLYSYLSSGGLKGVDSLHHSLELPEVLKWLKKRHKAQPVWWHLNLIYLIQNLCKCLPGKKIMAERISHSSYLFGQLVIYFVCGNFGCLRKTTGKTYVFDDVCLNSDWIKI